MILRFDPKLYILNKLLNIIQILGGDYRVKK